MGLEKYGYYIEKTKNVLYYEPGWCEENITGSWRSLRPSRDPKLCTKCKMCWLYCPEGVIDRENFEINLKYCKGCGICVEICPKKAIKLVREE